MPLHQRHSVLLWDILSYKTLHATDQSAALHSLTGAVGQFSPQQAPSWRQSKVAEGQRQALVQALTLLQGDLTLVQEQRPIQAVGPSRRAHLCGG